jgi:hypothetical protein
VRAFLVRRFPKQKKRCTEKYSVAIFTTFPFVSFVALDMILLCSTNACAFLLLSRLIAASELVSMELTRVGKIVSNHKDNLLRARSCAIAPLWNIATATESDVHESRMEQVRGEPTKLPPISAKKRSKSGTTPHPRGASASAPQNGRKEGGQRRATREEPIFVTRFIVGLLLTL